MKAFLRRLASEAKIPLLFASLMFVAHAFAASSTLTVSPGTTAGAGGGGGAIPAYANPGSSCSSAGALGSAKTVDFQCPGYRVYMRPACATDSAGCKLDAGYGDRVYDFRNNKLTFTDDAGGGIVVIPQQSVPGPVRLNLRSTESRVCFRNVDQPPDASTADAGDYFSCFLNEAAPF